MATLLVRADASVAMGTGHVMRCLALGQAWQDAGGEVVFAMAQTMPSIGDRLRAENVCVNCIKAGPGTREDAREVAELAASHEAAWVVVDGYQFDGRYQEDLKRAGLKVLFLDDSGQATHYACDVVLNQNAHASEELYRSRDAATRLLLGTKYALLRREFSAERGFHREITGRARKVLVTMGGSDPENLTLQVIQAFGRMNFEELEAVVIVGGSNPHGESLREAAAVLHGKVRLRSDVADMAAWMKWADVAVSAAGSTCWEMCLLGLPAILIDFAPNQTSVARELDREGAALHFGNASRVEPEAIAVELRKLISSADRRVAMSRKASALVDGRGAERVVSEIRDALSLHEVEEKDCRLLWEWANDPVVRRASFSPQPIGWDEHVAWFSWKLSDHNSRMFIATKEDVPVGQVRLDANTEGDVEIDISVAGNFRGLGYAARLLQGAVLRALQDSAVSRLHAFIRPSNQASMKTFERANFRMVGGTTMRGYDALHYVFERDGARHE